MVLWWMKQEIFLLQTEVVTRFEKLIQKETFQILQVQGRRNLKTVKGRMLHLMVPSISILMLQAISMSQNIGVTLSERSVPVV